MRLAGDRPQTRAAAARENYGYQHCDLEFE
jgi:hypothetical protein